MTRVLASMKVYPEDITTNLVELKDNINKALKNATLYKFEEEPIAFGLVAIIAHIILQDEKGIEDIEKEIKNVNGVSEVETLLVRRIG